MFVHEEEYLIELDRIEIFSEENMCTLNLETHPTGDDIYMANYLVIVFGWSILMSFPKAFSISKAIDARDCHKKGHSERAGDSK